MTPDLQALRHSVERDRYGLVAHVLLTRDHCTPVECAAFRSLTDHNQIVANMDERVYDGLISRYAPSWNMLGGAGARDGRRAAAVDADGQADQCRFSLRGLDTPGQHHDTRIRRRPRPAPAATSPPPPPRPPVPALSAAKKPPRHPAAPVQLAPAPPAALIPARAGGLKRLILCAIAIICAYSDRKTAIHPEINRRDRISRKIR